MVQSRSIPPGDDIKAIVGAIPGTRFTPGVVVAQEGPDSHLGGPEAAGAVLILHASWADDEAAQRFWRVTTSLKQSLPEAPGFIRLFSLFDGDGAYLVAFWRQAEDAEAFARGPQHREAMADFAKDRFLYSHFVGLYTTDRARQRNIFCELCAKPTPAPADVCAHCGNPLDDMFARQDALKV